ncbi:MAG: hypothetical protein ACPHWZ_13500 [Longimicrobiales bacterium]
MPTAKRWTALQLMMAWISVFSALVPLWLLLQAGIYTATLEGGVVRRLSGSWSSGFAASFWFLCAVAAVLCMSYLTTTWIRGREARASMRAAEAAAHRRVLI